MGGDVHAQDAKVLVTGAGGFLGRHVVGALRRRGARAVATSHRPGVDIKRVVDVCNRQAVQTLFAEEMPQFVVHCAAYGVNFADQDSHLALKVNVLGSNGLIEAAAAYRVKRFVHVGSCFEYGSHPGPIAEDVPLRPSGIYGASKAAATIIMAERACTLGLPLLIVRPFGFWGPGEGPHRLLPQIVDACKQHKPLDLTLCDVSRDYSYVEDIAHDLTALLFLPDLPGTLTVNLGSGEPVVLRDFVMRVAGCLGGTDLMRFGRRPHRSGELASVVADVSRMRSLLGNPSRTSLIEGLRRMGAEVVTAA